MHPLHFLDSILCWMDTYTQRLVGIPHLYSNCRMHHALLSGSKMDEIAMLSHNYISMPSLTSPVPTSNFLQSFCFSSQCFIWKVWVEHWMDFHLNGEFMNFRFCWKFIEHFGHVFWSCTTHKFVVVPRISKGHSISGIVHKFIIIDSSYSISRYLSFVYPSKDNAIAKEKLLIIDTRFLLGILF